MVVFYKGRVNKMKYELNRQHIRRGFLICVNADHLWDEQRVELEKLAQAPQIKLQKEVNKNLQLILNKIGAGNQIIPVSGFRSLKEQVDLYQGSLQENGEEYTKKFVALPNASEHQSGLAIDLALNCEDIDFICPSFPYDGICQTFRELAPAYGFIERYTKEKTAITKIAKEEWHFRYVGVPHSKIMVEKNFCLEEYIELIKQYVYPNQAFSYDGYQIAYIPYQDEMLWLDLKMNQSISGNNIDGFILTEKR